MNKRKVFTHGLVYLLLASVILNVVLFAKQRTKDKYETKSDTNHTKAILRQHLYSMGKRLHAIARQHFDISTT